MKYIIGNIYQGIEEPDVFIKILNIEKRIFAEPIITYQIVLAPETRIIGKTFVKSINGLVKKIIRV